MIEVRNPLLDLTEIEFIGKTRYAKRITCRECREVVFDVPDKPTQSELNANVVGLRAHFLIRHNVNVAFAHCDDPDCGK
jgi:hypothetical protein